MNEQQSFRKVVREVIKQELSEMTTTAAVPGYQTPFAFGDEEDEKKEDDIEEFLDTYGWEMAELAEKALKKELNEDEEKKLKQYIQKVRSMRDGDVSGYQKKSNYLPHNLEEAVGQEPTVIRTPKFDLRVYTSEKGNLKMEVIDSDGSRPVADITLGKRGGQKLMDAMTYHL